MRISDWSSDVCSSDLGVLKLDIAVVEAGAAHRGQPRAVLEHDEQILDHPVAQAVGQFDPVAIGGIALRIADRDVALGDDLSAPAVPCNLVGAHRNGRSEEHTAELQSIMRIPYS